MGQLYSVADVGRKTERQGRAVRERLPDGKGEIFSRFGLGFNKHHGHLGKVAHDRPKIKASQDEAYAIAVMLYDLFNPVRAGLIPDPTHEKWRLFSVARLLAFGERNEFSSMITLPEWHLRLGKTAAQRQRRFRHMLDQYAVERGLKKDPKKVEGHFVGGRAVGASHAEAVGQLDAGPQAGDHWSRSARQAPSQPMNASKEFSQVSN